MKTKKVSAIIKSIISPKAIVLTILFSLPFLVFGQWEKEVKLYSFENKEIAEYELTSFVCRYVEGKIYIMWTVLESSDNCIYKLERSTNDKDYDVIYSTNGAKSPYNVKLLNSFIDAKPYIGISYYKIRRVTKEKVIASSAYVVN